MTAFKELRDMIDDDPSDLVALAANDEPIRALA